MRRPYLLDTNVCIRWVDGQLHDAGEEILAEAYSAGLTSYVSPITAWEIATLSRKSRFTSNLSPARWFERLKDLPGVALAAMPPDVLIASQLLPGDIHNDPADRILAATAREYGFTLLTSDRALLAYGDAGHLSVIAC